MKEKKTCYISLPIRFHEDTVFERNLEAMRYAEEMGYTPVSPIITNNITEDNICGHESTERTAMYMGNDIKNVILCDAILMCDGWQKSKGCNVEHYTAEVYNKRIHYMIK